MNSRVLHRFQLLEKIIRFLISFSKRYLFRIKLHEKLYKIEIKIIRKRLDLFYRPCLDSFFNSYSEIKKTRPSNQVFIMWMQGYSSAPDIVKICIDSIYKYNKDKEIHLISKDNLDIYIQGMPSFVIESYNKGYLKIQHFSDILRTYLLSTRGGYWCDATLLCVDKLPSLDNFHFYSIKNENGSKLCISRRRWTTYFMYSDKNDIVTAWLYYALCYYLKNADYWMDYFLTDDTLDYAYRHSAKIREEIDIVPRNNPSTMYLFPILDDEYDEKNYKELTKDTTLFKLSWKSEINKEKARTYYKKILQINSR